MSTTEAAARTNETKPSGRGIPRAHFWLGIGVLVLATIGARAVGHKDGVRQQARSVAKPTVTPESVDRTSPWTHFWIGAAMVVLVTAGCICLYVVTGRVGQQEVWLLVGIWGFMAIPGLSLIVLGLYIRRKLRSGLVSQRLDRRDYWSLTLMLLPGTAISALGNLMPVDNPLVASWVPTVSWISLGLGTAVSVLLVRKFGKPTP